MRLVNAEQRERAARFGNRPRNLRSDQQMVYSMRVLILCFMCQSLHEGNDLLKGFLDYFLGSLRIY